MAVSRITREDMVEQSVTDYLRVKLFDERGYPTDRVEIVDAFQPSHFEATVNLDRNYVALGFNFDNGGVPGEMGSDLIRRTYTIEVWVIAQTPQMGRNLANAIRDSLQSEATIPLRNISAAGAPEIDRLIVDPVRVERQPVPDPKPWQENIWIVYAPVVDEYYASAV